MMNIVPVTGQSVQTTPNPTKANPAPAGQFTPTERKTSPDAPDPTNDDLTSDSDAGTDEENDQRKRKPRKPKAFNLKKSLRYVKRVLKQRQQTGLDHERFTEELSSLWVLMDIATVSGAYNGRVRTVDVGRGMWVAQTKDQALPDVLPPEVQSKVDGITSFCGPEPTFWQFANWLLNTQGLQTEAIRTPANAWAQPNT